MARRDGRACPQGAQGRCRRGKIARGLRFGARWAKRRSADFNGDGWPDLIAVDHEGDSVTLLLNQGMGRFALSSVVTEVDHGFTTDITIGDFNGDSVRSGLEPRPKLGSRAPCK